MFPPELFQPLLKQLAAMFTARQVPFALTGGLISVFYGEPRYTQDIDLVVDPEAFQDQFEPLIGEFERLGYMVNRAVVRDALERGRAFQLLHERELLKVDIYPRELVPGELARAQSVEVFRGWTIPIISGADLLLSKLVWISKGSHKSRRDARKVMHRLSPAAREQAYAFAEERGLRQLLDEVLAEPDEIDA
jgi:hypothetical protein